MTIARPFDVSILKLRHHFLRSVREYLDTQGFLEIETPYLLIANTPDPYIDPIEALLSYPHKQRVQLHTSPEIWLKRALGLGLPKIYELARVFRDDPLGPAHNKEFTMLEWYRTQADLDDLLVDCEHIFRIAAEKGREYLGHPIKNPKPFNEQSIETLFKKHAGIELNQVLDKVESGHPNYLQQKLQASGEHLPRDSTFTDAFFHIMIKYIEPNLNFDEPTVITRWPVQLAALAAPCADDPRYCGRFEIYYQGLEIANAYQECTDKEVLLQRFKAENTLRKQLGKPIFPLDSGFLNDIDLMPKTAGIALGIDRLLQSTLTIDHLKDLIYGFGDPKI